jgi:DNA-binding transcriptional ArsR family regulator
MPVRNIPEAVEHCDCTVVHEDIVNDVRGKLPDDGILTDLAELFKLFGEVTRVKILCALLHSEMCVCDMAYLLGMTESAVSHQLRSLRQTRLVKYRRDGKMVYYSLDDEHVGNIFAQGLTHLLE